MHLVTSCFYCRVRLFSMIACKVVGVVLSGVQVVPPHTTVPVGPLLACQLEACIHRQRPTQESDPEVLLY